MKNTVRICLGMLIVCTLCACVSTDMSDGSKMPRHLPPIAQAIYSDDPANVAPFLVGDVTPGSYVGIFEDQIQTLIDYAVSTKSYNVLTFLAERAGKDINKYSSISVGPVMWVRTPLIFAAHSNDLTAVQILIEHGASIDLTDWYDPIDPVTGKAPLCTALHYAAAGGYPEVTEYLIQKGADKNKKCYDGYTPLIHAQEYFATNDTAFNEGLSKVVGVLLKYKVDTAANGIPDKVLWVDVPLPEGAPPGVNRTAPVRGSVYSAIHFAAAAGFVSSLDQLINYGVSIESAPYKSAMTPLIIAAQNKQNAACVFLLSKGANVNAADEVGYTPLMYASAALNYELVDILLKNGAKVNMASPYSGDVPLSLAVNQNQNAKENDVLKVMTLLLDAGADVNFQGTRGYRATPLMWASGFGTAPKSPEKAKLLLTRGANPNLKNSKGDTALMNAAYRGYTDIGKALILAGADVNAKNNSGRTALMTAAEGIIDLKDNKPEFPAFIKLLLDNGADVNAKDNNLQTALSLAEQFDHKNSAAVLKARGGIIDPKEAKTDYNKPLVGVWVGENDFQTSTWTFKADGTWKHEVAASKKILSTYPKEMHAEVNKALQAQADMQGSSGTFKVRGDYLVLSALKVVGWEIRNNKLYINGEGLVKK